MKLHCHKCHHIWNEDVDESQPVVQCPECTSIVPMVLAKKAPGAPTAPPPPPPPPAPAEAEGETLLAPPRHAPPPAFAETIAAPAPMDLPTMLDLPDEIETIIESASTEVERPTPRAGSMPPPSHRPAPIPDSKPLLELSPLAGSYDEGEAKTVAPPAPAFDVTMPLAESTRTDSQPATVVPAMEATAPLLQEKTRSPLDPGESPTVLGESAPVRVREVTPIQASGLDTGNLSPGQINLVGQTIGGYRVEKMIGAGGMGAVCLAQQLSLDRPVALKILPTKFAMNPDLLMRFTREALSAAQLTHHNIIQVYDVGSQESTHYISMEFVRGDSLGNMIRKEGKLQIDDAAGYVLQAARGLKYAHDRGIIHRDIKPDNLMLNEHGIVKIADMGLAKMRGDAAERPRPEGPNASILMQARGDLTMSEVAMGTPAYMPPEQARDASTVDHRADQYSLGCTLYYLCAGKAPYSGTTAFELMSKHMTEPLTPLEVHVKAVPPALSTIIQKMLAKNPDDRYPGMEEVIKDLENYLGVESEKGPYTPREQHLAALEVEVKNYYAAKSQKKRTAAVLGFFLLIPILIAVSVISLADRPAQAAVAVGALLGLLVLTPFANLVLDGILNKGWMFRRARSVFFGMPWKSWLAVVGGALVTLLVLHILGWLWYWIGFAFVAFGLAAGYQFLVVRPLKKERELPLQVVQDMLKRLRVRGVSEEALHDFVCRFTGAHWEEFFESLFGYEEMVLARGKWAATEKVKSRKRFAVWRDPVARYLESVEDLRKAARERKTLAKAAAQGLKAKGMDAKEAEKQADAEATKILKEGLIKAPPPAVGGPAKILNFRKFHFPWKPAFVVARLLLGACMATMFASAAVTAVRTNLPGGIRSFLNDHYANWVTVNPWLGLLSGIAVLASAFSRRLVVPIFMTVGGVLLVFTQPIVRTLANPSFGNGQAGLAGFGLAVGGLAILGLGKFFGKKF